MEDRKGKEAQVWCAQLANYPMQSMDVGKSIPQSDAMHPAGHGNTPKCVCHAPEVHYLDRRIAKTSPAVCSTQGTTCTKLLGGEMNHETPRPRGAPDFKIGVRARWKLGAYDNKVMEGEVPIFGTNLDPPNRPSVRHATNQNKNGCVNYYRSINLPRTPHRTVLPLR
ncbi:hypothetical protein BGZ63DRAFT_403881 [Mariannaea sp. PMI_226]|nr:hypothetical protein BGZ63DRAFT_403881 [Mariannaea sp. PMI_226]